MNKNEIIDLSILNQVPQLDTHVLLQIRPLSPLSMVSEMPGSFYKSLRYPSKKMICGMLENMLGWHFDIKLRKAIFDDWKIIMKRQKKAVNLNDYQQGSRFIPLLMDYFELKGEPSLDDFKEMCSYIDLWNRCYRREDSSMHLNGCRNIDEKLIPERYEVSNGDKEKWFKENVCYIPCFYTTPTNREYVDIDGVYVIPLNMDKKLVDLLESANIGTCYLGNSEGWVIVNIKTTEL